MDAVPAGAAKVLDVGCGAGEVTARLATRAGHVDAVDADPVMVAAARDRVPGNVIVVEANVLADELPVTATAPWSR